MVSSFAVVDPLDVGEILRRELRDQLRPQIARDALGRVGLRDVLEIGEDEDADRHREELDDQRAEDELARGEGVDRARDQLRHEQVEALAAIVSTTIVAISGAYGFSRPVSFGPAGRAGPFESGTNV